MKLALTELMLKKYIVKHAIPGEAKFAVYDCRRCRLLLTTE